MSPKTTQYLQRHLPGTVRALSALDVGSLSINGSARQFVLERGYLYTGVDIEAGPNVDQVVSAGCEWDLGRRFDAVLCLNCLEHVDKPWVLVPTMARHVAPGGRLIIAAPFSFPEHRHPVDCFRYAPDGLISMLESTGLSKVACYLDYEASATYGTLSDIVWLAKRNRWQEAFAKFSQWPKRMCVWNCVCVFDNKKD